MRPSFCLALYGWLLNKDMDAADLQSEMAVFLGILHPYTLGGLETWPVQRAIKRSKGDAQEVWLVCKLKGYVETLP